MGGSIAAVYEMLEAMASVQTHSIVGTGAFGFPLGGSGDHRRGSVSGEPCEEDEDQRTDQEPHQHGQTEGQDQTLCDKVQKTLPNNITKLELVDCNWMNNNT